ncbi:MAG: dTMP kinase [Treponema sp.]|nr:dTMP kinase [Treponema sp.]
MVLKNFVVFEGIDGAGTSTQIELLKCSRHSASFDFSAEPTEKETGKFLRRVLKGDFSLDVRTTAYLFAADRAEHIWAKGGIADKSREGKICVSDRYLFSNLAYQGVTCGEELPRLLNSPFPLPQVLFFFKIDPAVSLSRIGGRKTREIYEKIDFLQETERRYEEIIGGYERESEKSGMKVVTLDAAKPMNEVNAKIVETLVQIGLLEEDA